MRFFFSLRAADGSLVVIFSFRLEEGVTRPNVSPPVELFVGSVRDPSLSRRPGGISAG